MGETRTDDSRGWILKISVTERSTFKECRRQWDYSTLRNLRPIQEDGSALWIGTGIHAALEAFYKGQDPIPVLTAWWLSEIDTAPSIVKDDPDPTWNLMLSMITGYVDFAKTADTDIEVLATEHLLHLNIPHTAEGILSGRLDLLVMYKGEIWVLDHKTCSSFSDEASLEFNDQMTAYLWMVQQSIHRPIAGAIYNQLKKKIPEKPMLLKDGRSLSKSKSISTTAEIYLATIVENGFDPNDYAEILEYLGASNQFYRREYIARTQAELATFEKELAAEYVEMLNAREDPARLCYRTLSRNCSYCSYAILCKAEACGDEMQSKALQEALFYVPDKQPKEIPLPLEIGVEDDGRVETSTSV